MLLRACSPLPCRAQAPLTRDLHGTVADLYLELYVRLTAGCVMSPVAGAAVYPGAASVCAHDAVSQWTARVLSDPSFPATHLEDSEREMVAEVIAGVLGALDARRDAAAAASAAAAGSAGELLQRRSRGGAGGGGGGGGLHRPRHFARVKRVFHLLLGDVATVFNSPGAQVAALLDHLQTVQK